MSFIRECRQSTSFVPNPEIVRYPRLEGEGCGLSQIGPVMHEVHRQVQDRK